MNELKYDLSLDVAVLFRDKTEFDCFLDNHDRDICRLVDTCISPKVLMALVRTTPEEYIRLKLIHGEDVWQR